MAKYDQGGGCACGLNAVCDCGANAQSDGSRALRWYDDESNMIYEIDPKSKKPKPMKTPRYKYSEPEILADLKEYLDNTYGEHYTNGDPENVQAFDGWIARGNSTDTFVNTAMKYLWRYGKKDGNNKKDLMKAMHYVFMAMYVDHYRDKK